MSVSCLTVRVPVHLHLEPLLVACVNCSDDERLPRRWRWRKRRHVVALRSARQTPPVRNNNEQGRATGRESMPGKLSVAS